MVSIICISQQSIVFVSQVVSHTERRRNTALQLFGLFFCVCVCVFCFLYTAVFRADSVNCPVMQLKHSTGIYLCFFF